MAAIKRRVGVSEFEALRQASLRTFEVTLGDGSVEIVKGHMHNGGDGPHGHLVFIEISPDGDTMPHGFNGDAWVKWKETTTAEEMVVARRAVSSLGSLAEPPAVVKTRKSQVH